MTDFITIRLEDSEFMRFATEFPRAVYNAQRSAHRKTATWAKKRIEKKLSDKYQLPLKTIKNYRSKRGGNDFYSSVTEGWNPIYANQKEDNSFLGKLRQTKSGAFAGKHKFPNGFIASMDNGHTAIFKRTGRYTNSRVMLKPSKKYPNGRLSPTQFKSQIAKEYINLTLANSEIEAEQPAISAKFKENFEAKMSEYLTRGIIVDDRQTETD
jgi:hypothetical protein